MSSALPEVISFAVYVYVAAGTAYMLVCAVAAKMGKPVAYTPCAGKKKMAVIIPAYREDAIIADTVQKAATHNYPHDRYRVVVVADSLQPATLQQLRTMPVQVVEARFDVSTKARSIHAALRSLQGNIFDVAVILDADNVMEHNCLEKINAAFHNGCMAVQCHRAAKNSHTSIALLDAISGEINAGIFRKGAAALGLSAAPAGSGMAISYNLLEAIFASERILGSPAEDREIDLQLMKARVRMAYLDDAYVYDEKVPDQGVFKKQRTRWLEAQLQHLLRFFDKDMRSAPKTADYFNRFIQTLLLPRLLYLVVFGLILVLFGVQVVTRYRLLYPAFPGWIALMVIYCSVLLVCIPPVYFTRRTLLAISKIPVLMVSMVKATLQMKRNRKEFIHTTKSFPGKPVKES